MTGKNYLSQIKKRNFTKKLFEKGLNAAGYILLALKEDGQNFLEDLPSSYPGFALMKWTFGVGDSAKQRINFKQETIRTNLHRLEKDGLIAKEPKEKVYCLTEEGKKFIAYVENRYLILKKPWDGKLRIIIFDIPESKRIWRRVIRQELLLMQFQQLQKSVYVGKYPLAEGFCSKIEEEGLGKYVFIFTVDKADRQEEILKLFEE